MNTTHYFPICHSPNHTRDIPHGMAPPPKASNEHFVILLNVVEAAIARDKGCDLLAILDQLHSDTLANGRVGLLRFHTTEKGGEQHLWF